jgi:hypothetical protein
VAVPVDAARGETENSDRPARHGASPYERELDDRTISSGLATHEHELAVFATVIRKFLVALAGQPLGRGAHAEALVGDALGIFAR